MASPSDQTNQDLRREILAAESRILELKDQIAAKQTEKADAVALLGQAELLLEEKIAYIIELDRSLNARIRELERECDRKSAEIDRRGEVIQAAEVADQKNRTERDAIIQDLSERLETANQEIGKAHALARDIDQDRAAQVTARKTIEQQHAETRQKLTTTITDLASAHAEIAEQSQAINELETAKAKLQATLENTTATVDQLRADLSNEQTRRETLETSIWWKLGRPWRALFGPKS